MQAYKDGIRSNQLGWHLLVSVLQLDRHITINDLLGDFHLFSPPHFTQIAATRPQLFINLPAFQASLLAGKVNPCLGCQHRVGWMPWSVRSCWFYSAPWVLGSLAAHPLVSRTSWGSRNWRGMGLTTTTCTHSHFSFSWPKVPGEEIQPFAAVTAVRGRAQSLIRGLSCPYSSVNP